MTPYRIAAERFPVPPTIYEVERPFFPQSGDLVIIGETKVCPWSQRVGHLGMVQLVSGGGMYLVAFQKRMLITPYGHVVRYQEEGAGIFSITELLECPEPEGRRRSSVLNLFRAALGLDVSPRGD